MRRSPVHEIATPCAVALMLLGSGHAVAQEETSSPDTEIVVTGKVQSKQEARRDAVDFVRETGAAAQQDSVARWVDPVCPKVFGTSDATAAAVLRRIRVIAAEAGAELAPDRCSPNIAIVFVGSGRDFVRDIVARQSERLGQMSLQARKSLVEADAPVRWWYAFEVRSKDGMPTTSMDDAVPFLRHYNSSLISTQALRAITAATVVVDVSRLQGRNPQAVAALAAFVALAEIKLDARPPGSVLSMFEPGGARAGLTARDQTFLNAVYKLPLDRKVNQQRNRIIGRMAKAATAGN